MRENQLIPSERKYIEIQYDDATQAYLREYCEANGFDLSISYNGNPQDANKFDFHSTVWFTTSEHQLANNKLECDITVSPVGFELFGENKNMLVLEVESDKLNTVRNYYGQKYGMTDEWPDYRPHITLSYNYKGEVPDIGLPTQNLIADKLNIKTQTIF